MQKHKHDWDVHLKEKLVPGKLKALSFALKCSGITWHWEEDGCRLDSLKPPNHWPSFINICFCLLQSYRGTAWLFKTDPSCPFWVLWPFYRCRDAFGAGEQSFEADRKCFCCPCQIGADTGSGCRRGRGGGKDAPDADDGSVFLSGW